MKDIPVNPTLQGGIDRVKPKETTKEKIKQIVKENPGVYSVYDVAEMVDMHERTVRYHLKNLKLTHKVKNIAGKNPNVKPKREIIADFIKENPNQYTRKEIGELLDTSLSTVRTAIISNNLEELVK